MPSHSKPPDVAPFFKQFVEQAQYLTKEVSDTNRRRRDSILYEFVSTHYTKTIDDAGTTIYTPRLYAFRSGANAPIKTVATAILTNNTNLVPCSIDVYYHNVRYEEKNYEIATKIRFDYTGMGRIESIVASTGTDQDIDLTGIIPLDDAIVRQTL